MYVPSGDHETYNSVRRFCYTRYVEWEIKSNIDMRT